MSSDNSMYSSVVANENTAYGNDRSNKGLGPSKKAVTFHNSSVEHVTITATNAETQTAVQVVIRKCDIPKWVVDEK